MKAFKLIGAAAAATLLLLSSCLGESDNTFSNTSFAVGGISEKNYSTVLNTISSYGYMSLYSPALEGKIVKGECYIINFEVNMSSPENANAATNGYYNATIAAMEVITMGNSVFSNVPDSTKLADNELPLKNLMGGACIDGRLFLQSTLDMYKDQRNKYTLYWNRMDSDDPVKEDDIPTYNLFLRAVKDVDGTGSSATSMAEYRAFNIKSVLESVDKTESNKGSEIFNLKINYLTSISEKDSSDLKWSSVKIPFQVTKQ